MNPVRGETGTGLYVERRGTGGSPVVFLHGLLTSGRYWHPVADRLARARARLFPVDLLGFGRSPWPKLAYSVEDHVTALEGWRLAAGLTGQPLTLVGHSTGALLALAWAAQSGPAAAVILVGLPVFRDPTQARRRLSRLSFVHRLSLSGPPLARVACEIMCHTRPVWRRLAPYLAAQGIPSDVARDAFLHTWASFSGTLERCVFGLRPEGLLERLQGMPVWLIHGTADRTSPVDAVRTLARAHSGTHLVEVPGGGHNLPLSHPERLAELLMDLDQSKGRWLRGNKQAGMVGEMTVQ